MAQWNRQVILNAVVCGFEQLSRLPKYLQLVYTIMVSIYSIRLIDVIYIYKKVVFYNAFSTSNSLIYLEK